jgi:hypothetical protein
MRHATLRSIITAGLLLATAAGCAPDATNPQTELELSAALAPGEHGLLVQVLDPAQAPVQGVLVTVTNTVTGDFQIGRTGRRGKADFRLPTGSYLVHARNLGDAGPEVPPFPQSLVVAPLPEGLPPISTAPTQGLNRLAVLYDPSAASGWVPLDPDNYSRLTANPALVLSGPSTVHSFVLQFVTGSPLSCDFVDSAGNPITLPGTENVFAILPHGSGPLPPLPSYATGVTLPRGILLGVTTAPAGATGCVLDGFAAGPGVTAILETNTVVLNGEEQVLVGAVPPQGSTAGVQLVAEPRRGTIEYLFDDFGDATGSEDVGLVTYGWALNSDDFVVGARFRGDGDYLINAIWTDPTSGANVNAWIRAFCDASGCEKTLVEPSALYDEASVTGSVQTGSAGTEGTLLFKFVVPGANDLQFRVLGGRPPRSDLAPDQGFQNAVRGGTGNTWLIPG